MKGETYGRLSSAVCNDLVYVFFAVVYALKSDQEQDQYSAGKQDF